MTSGHSTSSKHARSIESWAAMSIPEKRVTRSIPARLAAFSASARSSCWNSFVSSTRNSATRRSAISPPRHRCRATRMPDPIDTSAAIQSISGGLEVTAKSLQ